MARVIEAFSPDARPPSEPDRLKAAYQQTLAGKRALLLLDNAADTRQVAPLLPPAPVALLVTSRQRILLQGTKSLELRMLTPESALLLLRGMVPEARADDAALAAIARRCGHLPLALRAAGSFLQAHPSWTVEDYLDALAGERTRLAALEVPEAQLDVRSVLGLGLAKLREETPELAAAWTLLAVFPAGFDREAAAAVWQQDLALTRDRLDALVNRSLLTAEQEARFRLHDLLRDLAREQAEAMALQAAHLRHGEHYVSVLGRADELYLAGAPLDGLALFDSERANIEAAQAWAAAAPRAEPRSRPALLRPQQCRRPCPEPPPATADPRPLARGRPRGLPGQRELPRRGRRAGQSRQSPGPTSARPVRPSSFYEQHLAIARETATVAARATRWAISASPGPTSARPARPSGFTSSISRSPARSATVGARANALGNLGIARADLGETRKAIELYEQWLAIAREIGDRHGEGARWAISATPGPPSARPARPSSYYEQHPRDRPRDRRPSGRGRRAGQSRQRLGRPRRDPQGHRALRAASRDRPRDRRPSRRGQRAGQSRPRLGRPRRDPKAIEALRAAARHRPRDRPTVAARARRSGTWRWRTRRRATRRRR